MSNTDDTGAQPPVPFTNNVNVVQLVGAAAVLLTLATGGKYTISLADQSVIVGAIVSVCAAATVLLHTFVNHKANVKAALNYARRAELSMRKGGGKVLVFLVMGGMLMLGGCSSFTSNPQAELNAAQTAFNSALAIYNSICMTNATAAFCSPEDQLLAATLEKGVADAIKLAQLAIKASSGMGSSADVVTAVTSAEDAINRFDDFVNQLNAQKSAKLAAKLRSP